MTIQELVDLVSSNGMHLENLSDKQKSNKVIVLAAVNQNGIALKFAHENLKNDSEIVKTAVKKKGGALYFASENLKGNKEIALIAINKDGLSIEHASSKLKNDKEVVLKAVLKNGLALEHASLELKNDREVVLTAVTKNGLALKFSSPKLKKDEDLILKALSGLRKEKAFTYAFNSFQKNKDFVRKAYRINKYILKYLPDDIKDNKEFILELFQHYGANYKDLSDRLKADPEITFLHISENRLGISDIPYVLRSNKDFIKRIISDKALIKKHGPGFLPRVYKALSSKLQEDEDIKIIMKK